MKQYQAAFENSPAQDYLTRRGISPETAKAFGCGFAEAWEHWEKDKEERWQLTGTDRRVVFPITDPEGNILAVHGRAIDTEFLNSPKITKGSRKEALFQPANAFDADIIFLCEGPADAMALHECGFAAVASVATSIPSWLPNRRAFRKVFVAMDADETGDKSADKHINELRAHGARAVRLRPEGAKDWNEMLLKTSADALRNFIQIKIFEAFPDYEAQHQPTMTPDTDTFPETNRFEPGEALKSLHQSPYFTGWTNANLF
jgi:DNA primase